MLNCHSMAVQTDLYQAYECGSINVYVNGSKITTINANAGSLL
jgi:aerobic-type carbon monoxide dehydrogenase small subunit (CoxS/CutS family)